MSAKGDHDQTFLYPYFFDDIIVMFIYGVNEQRQHRFAWTEIDHTCIYGVFFMFGMIVLYVIRSKVNKNRSGISMTILDMTNIFTGHNDMNYRHRLESIFITLLIVQIFLMQSIDLGDIISSLSRSQNRIDSLEKMAKLKIPYYNVLEYNDYVEEMIRSVSEHRFHYQRMIRFLLSGLKSTQMRVSIIYTVTERSHIKSHMG